MRSNFTFDQALFGYDSGHHLLAGSLQLSADVRHLLAVATDLSGSAPAEGFDLSYTGLPLPGTNYYVLFCTWLAPEMSRPGCVWSHVLFIDMADLAEIENLAALRRAFLRPTSTNWESYQRPLALPIGGKRAPALPSNIRLDARRLLAALYLVPEQSVVIPEKGSWTHEDIIFAIWSQQWPRLRRNFRFSTGSFADRGRSGLPFDLQVTPKSNRRAWQREGEFLLADNDDLILDGPVADALSLGRVPLEDLMNPDRQDFRPFLRAYGVDVNSPRKAFVSLAFAFEQILPHLERDWTKIIISIGARFSDPSDALVLKGRLVNPACLPETEHDPSLTWAAASFLLASDAAEPYSKVPVDFGWLAKRNWAERKEQVLGLLSSLLLQPERPSASAFAAGVAEEIQPDELAFISEHHHELIPLFLGLRPSLAFQSEAWRLPDDEQWRIYEVLSAESLGAEEWREVMAAMLLAETEVGVRDVVRKAGAYAMEAALRWPENEFSRERLPSQIWRDALAVPAADLLRNAQLSPPVSLAFCCWFLPPEIARQVLTAYRQDIQELAGEPIEVLPSPLRVPTAFLLVTLGLRAGDVQGAKLFARGFFPTHDALATVSYPSESWQLLSPELPRLSMWKEWDRCKKLRRAARKRFDATMAETVARALLHAAETPEHVDIVHKIFKDLSI